MKRSKKIALGLAFIVSSGVILFVALPVGIIGITSVPFFAAERDAESTDSAMQAWTRSDCEEIWRVAKSLSESTNQPRFVEKSELPTPMIKAGFEGAYIEPGKFHARHGGSSFGSTGALVTCFFSEDEYGVTEPMMSYDGGRYFPDGRWEPFELSGPTRRGR